MTATATRLLWTRSNEQWDEATLSAVRERVPDVLLDAMPNYRRWQDVQMGLCGKLLLARTLQLADVDPSIMTSMTWSETSRPTLPIDGDFNISHSGGLIACAHSARARLGLDLEAIRDVPLEDIMQALSTEERRGLLDADDPINEFYRIWTFKEAVIKADGRGVGLDLPEISSLGDAVRVGDDEWYVQRLRLADGYDTHIACDHELGAIDAREAPLEELLSCR